MLIRNVNLPEPLIDAQRDGTLVVFAGAGISVGPPSNLPDFEELAIQVAGGALAREEREPIDRFLGRLEKQGIRVHRRTRDIIGDPNSKPTPLHHAILSLFRSPGVVRIVTTNFDRHFSTVAAELFEDGVEIYHAPALPLGRKFNGLVYLHGSVDKEPERLVLTDSDFGRAYLTDGWASRFLQEMFATYTVLFVGYSHDDPVMRYLARGLVPETSRYTLTEPRQDEHWGFLGITPVSYPLNDGPDRHSALGEAVDAWVEFSKRGALDHERRIREIVESTPPLDQEIASYIEHALEDMITVRFFTRHACTPEWLHWAESKQAFRSLFQTSERVDEVATEMAVWFAQNFVCEYPGDALALVQRQGQRLNPVLWQAIARELAFGKPRPDAGTLAKWVTVLLSSTQPDWRPDFLSYLLKDCRYPEDCITALLLFEHLTRPHLRLRPLLSFTVEDNAMAERVDVAISVEGDEHCLRESWKEIFQPNLTYFAEKLEPILTSHLIQAHLQLRAFGKANERWDILSFHRSAIEPHEQDRHPRESDTLVDAARDVIEWMLKHEPDRAHAVVEAWSTSGVPLLRRLAVHGITESLQIDPDEKIARVLDRDLLYTPGLKHEIFRLLERAYPHTTEPIRVRLLERVNRGPLGQAVENLKEETCEYEVYNLLVWLRRVAPDCPLTEERFKAIQEAHPDFGPREHPDLDSWMWFGRVGPRSPLTVDELLAKKPHEEIDWLLTYRGEEFMGPDREGLLVTVTEAVAQSFEWSWQLVVVLQEKEKWNSDVWGSIFKGWQEGSLAENQWMEVLTFLTDHMQLYRFAHPVADLLEKALSNEQGELPSSCLSLAEHLGSQLWDACVKDPKYEEEIERGDWLLSAINHPGGKIAELWLKTLSKRRSKAGESWTGLPVRYEEYFDKVLSGESYTAQLGRVVLASQIHFLFALDAHWTRASILPLLDWSVDERRAQQAWHGFLVWGRWNEALLPELLPLYEQSFARLSTELSSRRDRFCDHLASMAVYSSSNPMKDGWLRDFLVKADLESHKSWATNIGHQLRSLNEESVQDLWDRWMDDYWTRRNTGVPLPLSEDEKEVMVLWTISLEPVFPSVVEKICATPAPRLKHTFLYHQLVEKDFAARHSASLTRLLHHLLVSACEPFYHCSEVGELLQSLVGSAAPHGELLLVCEDLARLGCPNAAKLRALIEESNSG